jgi:enamine deaminase RidA (YjgF/YER057c/UK114 family)
MKRTPINPWSWSLNVGYNQAELIEGASRQLLCAGQTSVDAEGNPQHPEDMRNQVTLTPDNLEAVLIASEMGFSNVTWLSIYSTELNEVMKHFDLL